MPQNYTPEFKKKLVRIHEEEVRSPRGEEAAPIRAAWSSFFRLSFSLWERARTARKKKCCDSQKDPLTNPLLLLNMHDKSLETVFCDLVCINS